MLNYFNNTGTIFLVVLEVVIFYRSLKPWTLFEFLMVEKPPDLSWKHYH